MGFSVYRLFALGALMLIVSGGAVLAATEDDNEKPILEWTFDAEPDASQTSALALGDDGTWSAKVTEGEYVVENSKDKDAIRYVHFKLTKDDKPINLSDASVDVDVDGSFVEPDSGAGILYGYDPESKTYLGFLLTNDGYLILKRGKDGIETVAQGSHSHKKGEGATLEVNTLDSGELEFRIDDAVVATKEIDGVKGNDVGMISVGRGESDFDNFQIYSYDSE